MSKNRYFKAGDLLFREGRGFIPWVIRKITRCSWSHIVVCIDSTWCFEATHGEKVKVRPIEDFLRDPKHTYGYKVYYGPSIDKDCTKGVIERFVGREYEDDWFDLLGAALSIFDDHKENDSTLFCSELVAYYLQDVGVLKVDKLPDEYSPADFVKDRVPLKEGCYYGKMTRIV